MKELKVMEALFKIPASEFDEKLFNRIQSLLTGGTNEEVTITVQISNSKGILRHETREEYFERLLQAKNDVEQRIDTVSFKVSELKNLEKQLLNEL